MGILWGIFGFLTFLCHLWGHFWFAPCSAPFLLPTPKAALNSLFPKMFILKGSEGSENSLEIFCCSLIPFPLPIPKPALNSPNPSGIPKNPIKMCILKDSEQLPASFLTATPSPIPKPNSQKSHDRSQKFLDVLCCSHPGEIQKLN